MPSGRLNNAAFPVGGACAVHYSLCNSALPSFWRRLLSGGNIIQGWRRPDNGRYVNDLIRCVGPSLCRCIQHLFFDRILSNSARWALSFHFKFYIYRLRVSFSGYSLPDCVSSPPPDWHCASICDEPGHQQSFPRLTRQRSMLLLSFSLSIYIYICIPLLWRRPSVAFDC